VNRARAVILVLVLALVAPAGWLPWNYASQYETFRVDFSPFFTAEWCSHFGLFLKGISILTWVGGAIVLGYCFYQAPSAKG